MDGFVKEQIGDCSHSSLTQDEDKSQDGQQWIHLQTSSGGIRAEWTEVQMVKEMEHRRVTVGPL